MFTRRSARAITSVPQYNQPAQGFNNKQYNNAAAPIQSPQKTPQQATEVKAEPIVETPPPVTPMATSTAEIVDIPDSKDVSATTKALKDQNNERRWKKGARASKAERKKKMNNLLSKIVVPKSAVMLLHELKPRVTFVVTQSTSMAPMVAEVRQNDEVIATGSAQTKAAAKSAAADEALKKIIAEIMESSKNVAPKPSETTPATDSEPGDDDPMEQDSQTSEESAADNLPWAGLASYAMYRLLHEWHADGLEVPMEKMRRPNAKMGTTGTPKSADQLPENPTSLHPAALLNLMRPGIVIQELSRTPVPNPSVTVAYPIDGKLYKGTATNRKAARKEAAKVALTELYGVVYPSVEAPVEVNMDATNGA